jgi:hypothetical protein
MSVLPVFLCIKTITIDAEFSTRRGMLAAFYACSRNFNRNRHSLARPSAVIDVEKVANRARTSCQEDF